MKRNDAIDLAPYLPPPKWSGRWWEPTELLVSVRDHNEQVPSAMLFTRPELKRAGPSVLHPPRDRQISGL